MLNTQITAERIKSQAKCKGISVKKLLESCNLGVNTVTKMSNGTDVVSQNLLKIAEYLNVSTDYLLGRTDNPDINYSIKTGNITGFNVKGNTSINIGSSKEQDTIKQNFINLFDNLSPENQIEVMYFTKQLTKKEELTNE